jgi:membrane associated rhomboid family serine protease
MTTSTSTCYRHGDRRAGVTCQRCSRPICANCMIQASVGFQCPECARGGRQQVINAQNLRSVDRPYATYVLIALNAAVFVIGEALGQRGVNLTAEGGLISGTLDGFAVGVLGGEWWRIVTSGFLHANWLHLGMNMLVLWMLGSQLEPALGRTRFVGLYVTSLLAASLAVLAFSPTALTVGASGAVYGLFGVVFIHQRSLRSRPRVSGR